MRKTTRNREIRQSISRDGSELRRDDCVAAIVARPFTPTVKGGNKPSGEEIGVLFPPIRESGGVLGLELKLFLYELLAS